jgi:alpha-glucosidase
VFLRNAHAQEVLLKPSGITWRALGGTIDLYFYSGPKAEDVMKAYQQTMTGLPAMQQYWTLGFHQCRWGYENWTVVEDVVDNFAKFEIPLETIWSKSEPLMNLLWQAGCRVADPWQPILTT